MMRTIFQWQQMRRGRYYSTSISAQRGNARTQRHQQFHHPSLPASILFSRGSAYKVLYLLESIHIAQMRTALEHRPKTCHDLRRVALLLHLCQARGNEVFLQFILFILIGGLTQRNTQALDYLRRILHGADPRRTGYRGAWHGWWRECIAYISRLHSALICN
jgi:hypothetical protein